MYIFKYIPLQSVCLSGCSKEKETFRKVQKTRITELVISKTANYLPSTHKAIGSIPVPTPF